MPNDDKFTTIVIFGASGDLTWRKLVPALYNNYLKGRLAGCREIIGFARRPQRKYNGRSQRRRHPAREVASDENPADAGVRRRHPIPRSARPEPACVLIHGLGSASSADYPSLVRRPGLAHWRLVLPDLLGFGFSDRPAGFDYSLEAHAETVFALIQELGLASVSLFGHSMGGNIALTLAAAHPKCVGRLVLAESGLTASPSTVARMITAQSEASYVASGHAQFLAMIRRTAHESPGLAAFAGALAIADPVAVYRSTVGLVRPQQPSLLERFVALTIPRAYIVGQHSLPDPEVDRLQAAGVPIIVVPRAGHGMMHDNPAGFARALAQALGSEPPSAVARPRRRASTRAAR